MAEERSVSGPIVLFDGVCNFCSVSVGFIVRRERRGCFRFAALQSAAGGELLARHGLTADAGETFVLIEGGRAYTRSGAALRIARRLRFPYPLLFGLIVVPAIVRDFAYGWFARRRYRWFGRRDECMTPAPELRGRFLPD
jgi:predicted DCC family thiol-disulfide oxidoreductase YuxK